jgi:hypothetical protein
MRATRPRSLARNKRLVGADQGRHPVNALGRRPAPGPGVSYLGVSQLLKVSPSSSRVAWRARLRSRLSPSL